MVAQANIAETGKKILSNKIVWISIGAIVIIILISRLVRKIFKPGGLFSSTTEADQKRLDTVASGIGSLKTDPSRRSKTVEQIAQRADAIYQAMYGLGTNEAEVLKALEGLTTEDLKELYKQFGIKEEKWFLVTTFKGDLFGWFLAEFKNEPILEKLKSMFADTKIWY